MGNKKLETLLPNLSHWDLKHIRLKKARKIAKEPQGQQVAFGQTEASAHLVPNHCIDFDTAFFCCFVVFNLLKFISDLFGSVNHMLLVRYLRGHKWALKDGSNYCFLCVSDVLWQTRWVTSPYVFGSFLNQPDSGSFLLVFSPFIFTSILHTLYGNWTSKGLRCVANQASHMCWSDIRREILNLVHQLHK